MANVILTETQFKILIEQSYHGLYEGDPIKVGHISRKKLPREITHNVLRSISNQIQSNVSQREYKNGKYDEVVIPLFGQLFAFLKGQY